ILSALEKEDWCVPLVDEVARAEVEVCSLRCRVVLFPVWTAQIPVGEENFFGVAVHPYQVENTTVRNKCLEAVSVDSGKIERRISAVAGSDTSEAPAIYIRFVRDFVDG